MSEHSEEGHGHGGKIDDTSFTSAIPILNVKSVAESIDYYTTVLGFTRNWDWPDGDERKTFGSISNGAVTVFFTQNDQPEIQSFLIYYNVSDVDRLHELYKAAGAEVTQVPTDEPWQMREMLVADPDGHVLRIGSEIEHDR